MSEIRRAPFRVGFLLFPGFPMSCLTSLIEPLRAANEIVAREEFDWRLLSEGGTRITSSARVGFEADGALADARAVDLLLLLGAPTSDFVDRARGRGTLRDLDRHGTQLGAVSGGVFALMRSGTMAGRPVSVHWCYGAAFRTEFPDADARADVLVSGWRRHTASGAAAAFDLALRLIEERVGAGTAHEVACWFQHPQMRGQGVAQRVPPVAAPDAPDGLPPLVARAATRMAEDLSDPVPIAEIAEGLGVTQRQVSRAFRRATGDTPTAYLRALRMRAARQMVQHSQEPLAEVAAAVGYTAQNAFVANYRAAFGLTPREDRARINRFRVEGTMPLPS